VRVFQQMTSPMLGSVARTIRWNTHPLAGRLAVEIMKRYMELGDVQMISLLSSITLAFQARYDLLPESDNPIWTPALMHTLENCRLVYADWLFCLHVLYQRAELLKYDALATGVRLFERGYSSSHQDRALGMPALMGSGGRQAAPRVSEGERKPILRISPTAHSLSSLGSLSNWLSSSPPGLALTSTHSPAKSPLPSPAVSPSTEDGGSSHASFPERSISIDNFVCSTRAHCVDCTRGERSSELSRMRCGRCRNVVACSICRLPVRGLLRVCRNCNHGGHYQHMTAWFKETDECPTGCGCLCAKFGDWS